MHSLHVHPTSIDVSHDNSHICKYTYKYNDFSKPTLTRYHGYITNHAIYTQAISEPTTPDSRAPLNHKPDVNNDVMQKYAHHVTRASLYITRLEKYTGNASRLLFIVQGFIHATLKCLYKENVLNTYS